MSIKAKPPEEDPETKARREAAEARADAGRIDETRDSLGIQTRAVLRQFGQSGSAGGLGQSLASLSGSTTGSSGFFGGSYSGASASRQTSLARF